MNVQPWCLYIHISSMTHQHLKCSSQMCCLVGTHFFKVQLQPDSYSMLSTQLKGAHIYKDNKTRKKFKKDAQIQVDLNCTISDRWITALTNKEQSGRGCRQWVTCLVLILLGLLPSFITKSEICSYDSGPRYKVTKRQADHTSLRISS